MDRRTQTTLLYLLRGYAQQVQREHGKLVEWPGGLELRPSEMYALADAIEDGRAELTVTEPTDEDLLA